MNVDLSKNKQEILDNIKHFSMDLITNKLPFLLGNCSVLVAGSLATDTYDSSSDIDLHIVRSEAMQKENINLLKEYKSNLIGEGSNIELRFARTYEILNEYLNWNDDYILGELQNSIVIYDADNKFSELMNRFNWYPEDIYQDKLKWLFAEMLVITEKELNLAIHRKHKYYIEVLRTKYLRYLLTLIRLLNKKYPVYDKKLLETTLNLLEDEKSILSILLTANYEEILTRMKKMNQIYITRVQGTLGESINQENLLKFSTKNKISFE